MSIRADLNNRPVCGQDVLKKSKLVNDGRNLPYGWLEPTRATQRGLFPDERDILLARMRVSLDEATRWHEKRWLSFDPRTVTEIHDPERNELLFLRNLVQSGFSDAQIQTWLDPLSPPYSYDPILTAYSFAHGWVRLPPQTTDCEVDDFIRQHLDEWVRDRLREGDEAALRDVLHRLQISLADHRAATRRPEENGEAHCGQGS